MSKVDAMQAMREARYAARTANKTPATGKPASAAPSRKPASARTHAAEAQAAPADGETVSVRPDSTVSNTTDSSAQASETPDAQEALCGHRSMNNRLCRRPAGHSEKNHRYS